MQLRCDSCVQEHNKETRRKVAHDLQALKRDVAPAEGTSYSDFVKVASEIEKLQSDAQLRTEQIDDIKFKDISGYLRLKFFCCVSLRTI